MAGSSSDAIEMSTFLQEGQTAAQNIQKAFNTWVNAVAPLAASKGQFATAFENTKTLVQSELNNLSKEMNGIATNVSEASKAHQVADQEQDQALKSTFAALQASRG